eukprot:m51a1_g7931 hypothetical protein (607) ;mRNA; r:47979-49940
MAQRAQRARPAGAVDVLSLLPDACVVASLLPLLCPDDLRSVALTCRRLRALCRHPSLWRSLALHGDRQAVLLSQAPHLRKAATTSLSLRSATDVGVCCSVALLGPALRTLALSRCSVGDATLAALAAACPALCSVALEHCSRLSDAGTAALARACGRRLCEASESGCKAGAGRGFLEALVEVYRSAAPERRSALPLRVFASDSLSLREASQLLAFRPGAFARLEELRLLGGAAEAPGDGPDDNADDGSGAERVCGDLALACPALAVLVCHRVGRRDAAALARLVGSLRSVSVLPVRGDEQAGALLAAPSLDSLAVRGASAAGLLAQGLSQCAWTLAELALGSDDEPQQLTPELAAGIAALRRLRALRLRLSDRQPADAQSVAALRRCAPLEELALAGTLQLTPELASSPACAALRCAELRYVAATDAALAALPGAALRRLALAYCSGHTAAGVAGLLGRAPLLGALELRELRHSGIGNDHTLGALAPLLRELPGLRELRLDMPQATDRGAAVLAAVLWAAPGVETIWAALPDVSKAGVCALLRAARLATSVGLRECVRFDEEMLELLGPRVVEVALDSANKAFVRGSAVARRRPRIEFRFETHAKV